MKVEICTSNYESAKAALEGGADRIELCTKLAVGGLTPSRDLLEKVVADLNIPVHVLIRPRAGDFMYSEDEIRRMLEDIEFCKDLGCTGIVSGVLTSEGNINALATQRLIAASMGMHFTFHRAFDLCKNPHRAIDDLLVLGVQRILSSGQRLSAIQGLKLLKEFKALSEGKIEIMPGGGIDESAVPIFKEAGFGSIHLSAIRINTQPNSFFDTGVEGVSDLEIIKKVVALAQ